MKSNTASKWLIICSCFYLALGLLLGLLVALKFMIPTVGEIELLSFPRIRSLHTNVVLFGWLFQADMGLLLAFNSMFVTVEGGLVTLTWWRAWVAEHS